MGYVDAMKKYGRFTGRATRSEFWRFQLAVVLFTILAFVIDGAIFGARVEQQGVLYRLVALAHMIPSFAVGVRRLHDIDRTGWWLLLSMTGVGLIVPLVFWTMPSTPGRNRFDVADAIAPVPAIQPHQQPSAPPAAPAPPRDLIADLERLSQLRASGGISDVEFEALKAQALAPRPGS